MERYKPNELAKAEKFSLVIDQVIVKISDEVIEKIKMGENVLTESLNIHFTLGMNIRNSILMQQKVKDQIRVPYFTISERMDIDYANGWGVNISYKEFKESFKE